MSDTSTPRTNAALIKNLNAIRDAEVQAFINGVSKDVVEEMVKLERDLAEANAEISRLREDCKNLASERDGLETLKADLEKKDAMLIALCHDYEMQGQAYSKALADLAAKNAEISALRSDNDKLCAENHDFRDEFALENIALTKQLATARECLELIAEHGGRTVTEEGMTANGTWCADQAKETIAAIGGDDAQPRKEPTP